MRGCALGTSGPGSSLRTLLAVADMRLRGADVDGLMQTAIAVWEGRPVDDMEQLSERLMMQRIGGMLYPEALELIDAHRRKGHTIALASSATRYQVAPLAAELLIDEILCTEVEVDNGVFTGRLAAPVRWGEGKAQAVREFAAGARHRPASAASATATATRTSPFLETVGKPRPLNPERGLAQRRGGARLARDAPRPRGPAGPAAASLRTGAALAGHGRRGVRRGRASAWRTEAGGSRPT